MQHFGVMTWCAFLSASCLRQAAYESAVLADAGEPYTDTGVEGADDLNPTADNDNNEACNGLDCDGGCAEGLARWCEQATQTVCAEGIPYECVACSAPTIPRIACDNSATIGLEALFATRDNITDAYGDCGTATGGPEVVFAVDRVPLGAEVRFTLEVLGGKTGGLEMYVIPANGDERGCFAANCTAAAQGQNRHKVVELNATASTYYVVVEAPSAQDLSWFAFWACTTCGDGVCDPVSPGANENCAYCPLDCGECP